MDGQDATAPATSDATPAAPGGGGPAGGPVARDPGVPAWVPSQFKTGEDLARSYNQLVTRMGETGLRPKDASEYQWNNAPEGIKLDDESSMDFKKLAHDAGLSTKQFNTVMDAWANSMNVWSDNLTSWATGRAEVELRKSWPSDAEYQANLQAGYKTVMAFAETPEEMTALEEVNHPAVWRLFAKIGKQLREDGGMAGMTMPQAGETADSLMAMPAYQEALKTGKHTPESEKITAKLAALRGLMERKSR